MNLVQLTRERVVALAVVVLQVLCSLQFSTVSSNPSITAGAALLLSLPGLLLIWFREPLSTVGFMRGVRRESPPQLVDVFGWLFLIGLPMLYLYGLLP